MNISTQKKSNIETPKERLKKYGIGKISNSDLLSMILENGKSNEFNNILSKLNDITDLEYMKIKQIKDICNISEQKAIRLLSCLELGRRLYSKKNMERIKLNSALKIYDYMKNELINKSQEYFYTLYLDDKKNLIEKKLLYIGTLNKTIVHPREVFKYAYLYSASSIICVHNHPNGDPNPSFQDISLTKNLVELGYLNDIKINDHIIIGNGYYSFFENGDI